jgi:hypothetical protein
MSWNESEKHASYFSYDPRTSEYDLSKCRELIIKWRGVVSKKNTVLNHNVVYISELLFEMSLKKTSRFLNMIYAHTYVFSRRVVDVTKISLQEWNDGRFLKHN